MMAHAQIHPAPLPPITAPARFLALCLIALTLFLSAPGCTKSAGVIFPPSSAPLLWPKPPDTARISHVGQIATSADLKAPVGLGEAISRAIFGGRDSYSMLSPFAACTDGADRLFVADSQAQLIHVFDLNTRAYARWTVPPPHMLSQAVGVAWDPAGRLLVSDSVGACIHVFSSSGKYLSSLGVSYLRRPAGLTFDTSAGPANGRILVVDSSSHELLALSPTGQLLTRIGGRGDQPGCFNYPTNVAVDHNGLVYVSDTLNFRVQQFDRDLKPLRTIGRQGDRPGYFAQPKGIAIDSENHLYVVDSRFEAVQIFDNQGQLLLSFGHEGKEAGQFWLPAGIFIDPRNRIWVADAYNRRVQVFDYLPENQP